MLFVIVRECRAYLQQLQRPFVIALIVAKLTFQCCSTVFTRLQGYAEPLDGPLGSHGSRRAIGQVIFMNVCQHGQLAVRKEITSS